MTTNSEKPELTTKCQMQIVTRSIQSEHHHFLLGLRRIISTTVRLSHILSTSARVIVTCLSPYNYPHHVRHSHKSESLWNDHVGLLARRLSDVTWSVNIAAHTTCDQLVSARTTQCDCSNCEQREKTPL